MINRNFRDFKFQHKRNQNQVLFISEKIKNDQVLNPEELKYYSNLTRIYKNSSITTRSKIYHTKLSPEDEKPPCKECGEYSLYYCNMNDQYFCNIHVVGHDKNEI